MMVVVVVLVVMEASVGSAAGVAPWEALVGLLGRACCHPAPPAVVGGVASVAVALDAQALPGIPKHWYHIYGM